MNNAPKDYLPVEVLQECFEADFGKGRLIWKRRPRDHFATENGWKVFNSNFAGREAIATPKTYGCESALTLCGEKYRLSRSRVLWAMKHGAWPRLNLGHRNDDHFDDRIENLREQTVSQQAHFARSKNKTGVRGVYPTRDGKFFAAIRLDQQQKWLGTFDTIGQANAAYAAAAKNALGEFARIVEPSQGAGEAS